jgi:hypothetical protein
LWVPGGDDFTSRKVANAFWSCANGATILKFANPEIKLMNVVLTQRKLKEFIASLLTMHELAAPPMRKHCGGR